MAFGKKTFIAGFAALSAAVGGWFYKVATTDPVVEIKPMEETKTEEVVPAAKPEPEISWYEWAKSYIPEFKMNTNTVTTKEKSTGDIIHDQLKGP